MKTLHIQYHTVTIPCICGIHYETERLSSVVCPNCKHRWILDPKLLRTDNDQWGKFYLTEKIKKVSKNYQVPWNDLEKILGKTKYKDLLDWLYGKTISGIGPYLDDVEKFLSSLAVID